ncbi:protein of unknown function [Hyphomicrobium sp. 1Nfss2.1]
MKLAGETAEGVLVIAPGRRTQANLAPLEPAAAP